MENLPTLVAKAINAVQRIGANMTEPEEDWDPMLMLHTEDNKLHVLHAIYHSEDEKYAFWDDTLPKYIVEHKVVEFTAVLSAWIITRSAGEPHIAPRLAPDRKEVVGIAHVTASEHNYYCADLMRCSDRPPVLGDFELMSDTQHNITRRAQIALKLNAITK